MIQLAAFFGNPGREYARNRHNAGFLLADRWGLGRGLPWEKKFQGLYCCERGERTLHLLKPQTFMNRSGEPVQRAAAFFKIEVKDILVVHDELELPLGTVSLKFGGGLGGHNGLRSMRASFSTPDFWRIRIGIGRPDHRAPGQGGPPGSGEGIIPWVLSDFSPPEEELLDPALDLAAQLLSLTLTQDPQDLLKDWAKRKIELPRPDSIENH